MVASLGVIIQGLNTGILPNPTFSETNLFEAVKRVYYENPGALIQVLLKQISFQKDNTNYYYLFRSSLPLLPLKSLLLQLKVPPVQVISDGILLILDQKMKPN